MAQVKPLKLDADGFPRETDSAADDVTLASFSVTGGGPVLSATGLDLNAQSLSDASSVTFTDPTTGFINQTAGNLVVDNIMAKERSNVLTTAADILFPTVTDVAGQVDSFRLPALAGAPTATPSVAGEGYMVWDSSGDRLNVWTGSAWKDLSVASTAESLDNQYVAEVSTAARDVVFISSANNVSPATAATAAQGQGAIGLALSSAAPAASVYVRSNGIVSGFSGLTAGATYYLSASTPGAVSTSVPTGAGHVILKVGNARSATALHLGFQYLGRRA